MVAVLEPGDSQCLAAVLPAALAAAVRKRSSSADGGAEGPAAAAAAALGEPSRLACAESLAQHLVVCWEMITGAAAAAGQLPRGRVPLAPVDVAANITQGVCALVGCRGCDCNAVDIASGKAPPPAS